jgi:hypothetical protein
MQTDTYGLNSIGWKEYQRAVHLNNRAAKYQEEGNTGRPEGLYLRALDIKEKLLGMEHPEVALTLNNLAVYYRAVGRSAEARVLLERALSIFQKALGSSHPSVAATLLNLAQALKAEASVARRRASVIQRSARDIADPRQIERAVIRAEYARFQLQVRASRIHRFGVFACEPIPEGAFIIEYSGERIARRESVRRSCRDRTYVFRLDSYWRLDGSVNGSGAQLINHCCKPNCRFIRQQGRIWVASLRPIDPGEELTLDYRFPKDSPRVSCYCGAAACRGTINVP